MKRNKTTSLFFNLICSSYKKEKILLVCILFFPALLLSQNKKNEISTTYLKKLDNVTITVSKTKVLPGDSIQQEIKINKNNYSTYSIEKNLEKNDAEEDLAKVLYGKWEKSESKKYFLLKRKITFLKGGEYNLASPLLKLNKPNQAKDIEAEDFPFPEIKISVKTLLSKKKNLTSKSEDLEQYGLFSFQFSLFRIILVLVLLIAFSFLIYHYRTRIKKIIKNFFTRPENELEVDAIILNPDDAWRDFKQLIENLLEQANNKEKPEFILSQLEKGIVLFLSRTYKVDLRSSEEIHIFTKLKNKGIVINQTLQEEFNTIFNDWLYYKYAKKNIEHEEVLSYIYKLNNLAEKVYLRQQVGIEN